MMLLLEDKVHTACDGRKRSIYIKKGSNAHYVRYQRKLVRKSEINRMIKLSKKKQTGGGDDTYVFISDLEGYIPEGLVNCVSNTFYDDVDKFERLQNLKQNYKIIFTGDLIDRGSESLRLMNTFMKLHDDKEKATLVVGNRDVNKMRLKHELYSGALENVIKSAINYQIQNQNNNYISLQTILDRVSSTDISGPNWGYTWNDLNEIINIEGIYMKDDPKNDVYGGWERVDWTYKNTLGAGNAIDFFREELEFLGVHIPDNITNNINILGALLAMIMSYDWNLPIYVNDINLNNLYFEYLSRTIPVFEIQIGTKYIFATHSGLPKCPGTSNKQFCSNHIAFKTNVDKSVNVINLQCINCTTKNNSTNSQNNSTRYYKLYYDEIIRSFYNNNYYRRTNADFKTLMSMAAACGEPIQSTSPIVGYTSNDADGPCQWEHEGYTINHSDRQTIHEIYNICGHQPVGLVPEVGKVLDNNKAHYHVRLDVSKAEAINISNKSVYGILIITEQTSLIKCEGYINKDRVKNKKDIITSDAKIDINMDITEYCSNHSWYQKENKYHRKWFPINRQMFSSQFKFDILVSH
jgi:hypothetical protein